MESRMKPTAAAEGIDITYDGDVSSTLDAHRLLTWAAAKGRQNEVAEAVFQRYFERGVAPGDARALADAAAEAGLDRAEAEAFLATDELKASVIDEARRVREAYGVTGVPFFVVHADGSDKLPIGVPGAQDSDVLVKVVQEALKDADASKSTL